jgi:hypothetical protein
MSRFATVYRLVPSGVVAGQVGDVVRLVLLRLERLRVVE